jgi:hypothetical protein
LSSDRYALAAAGAAGAGVEVDVSDFVVDVSDFVSVFVSDFVVLEPFDPPSLRA